MSTQKESKINKLLQEFPAGTVLLSSFLRDHGYSLALQKRYRNSKWLESIGSGAMKRKGDQIRLEGGIYALQKQKNMGIHIGAKSALSLLGKAQYLEMGYKKAFLFGNTRERLPIWFSQYDWGVALRYFSTSFLSPGLGLTQLEQPNFQIQVSGAERAMMECLYLVPQEQNLVECYEMMESLNTLRPALLQKLLEECTSVKVKRMFLYLSEMANHDWFKYLKTENIDIGSGKRSLEKRGTFVSKYQITVPKELIEFGRKV